MPNIKHLLIAIFLACGAVTAVIFTFTPQVPILMWEGFPSEVWTGEGRYASVEGMPASEDDQVVPEV